MNDIKNATNLTNKNVFESKLFTYKNNKNQLAVNVTVSTEQFQRVISSVDIYEPVTPAELTVILNDISKEVCNV